MYLSNTPGIVQRATCNNLGLWTILFLFWGVRLLTPVNLVEEGTREISASCKRVQICVRRTAHGLER